MYLPPAISPQVTTYYPTHSLSSPRTGLQRERFPGGGRKRRKFCTSDLKRSSKGILFLALPDYCHIFGLIHEQALQSCRQPPEECLQEQPTVPANQPMLTT